MCHDFPRHFWIYNVRKPSRFSVSIIFLECSNSVMVFRAHLCKKLPLPRRGFGTLANALRASLAFCALVIPSLHYSAIPLFGHPSLGHFVIRQSPCGHSIIRLLHHSMSPSVSHSIMRSSPQSAIPSLSYCPIRSCHSSVTSLFGRSTIGSARHSVVAWFGEPIIRLGRYSVIPSFGESSIQPPRRCINHSITPPFGYSIVLLSHYCAGRTFNHSVV